MKQIYCQWNGISHRVSWRKGTTIFLIHKIYLLPFLDNKLLINNAEFVLAVQIISYTFAAVINKRLKKEASMM